MNGDDPFCNIRSRGELTVMRRMAVSERRYLAVVGLFLLMGCAGGTDKKLPDLAPVTGVVTLDGKPLKDVVVVFEPKEKGSNSTGTTDENGKFELSYADKTGAAVGSHTVRITNANEAEVPVEQLLPAKFNSASTLTATVEKGKTNEFTFDLKLKN